MNRAHTLTDAPPPYGTFVFDCDSTLSAMEGIEELAGARHAEELGRMTDAAMDGEVPLEEVYGRRLELVRPSRADVERIGELYVEHALPHVRELFAALLALEKHVHVVSGGLLLAVERLARALGVPEQNVHAVGVLWNDDGSYAGFESTSPLARAGGKIEVLSELAARPGAGSLVFVGDGATDLEAAHLAARFVAFGGVARRPAVFDAALVHTESADLAALVPLFFSPAERATLASTGHHSALLTAAPSP